MWSFGPCSLAGFYHRFCGTCCHHLQVASTLKIELKRSCKPFRPRHLETIFTPIKSSQAINRRSWLKVTDVSVFPDSPRLH